MRPSSTIAPELDPIHSESPVIHLYHRVFWTKPPLQWERCPCFFFFWNFPLWILRFIMPWVQTLRVRSPIEIMVDFQVKFSIVRWIELLKFKKNHLFLHGKLVNLFKHEGFLATLFNIQLFSGPARIFLLGSEASWIGCFLIYLKWEIRDRKKDQLSICMTYIHKYMI